ncbi:MAG: phosphatase PAP2 family protein [Bacteroidia bacterium]|nr:phosphatase PAP2 family protein [Bacteroidia bacterium]MCX7651360.1 phosphatase PAP2 family protein [Bacteroidia bacterium]MDW8416740.1 phosphatase PAP2 family protein [Bacteroidia bacterium]
MELIYQWDTWLLLLINSSGAEPWDTICWYGTQSWTGLPLYFIAALWTIWRRKWRHALSILSVTAIAVGTADLLTGRVLKPLIGRLRPSHDPIVSNRLRLVHNYRGGRFGCPSNHAANSAAGVIAYAALMRHPMIWLIGGVWAFFHSFTRVYLGVHYPSDIILGWLVGSAVALILLRLFKRLYA